MVEFSTGEVQEISKDMESKSAIKVLNWALDTFHPRIALASSFGAEDVVVIDMLAKLRKDIQVFTIDTGRLNQETYDVMDAVRDKYGITIDTYFPDQKEVEEMVTEHGLNLFYRSVENRKRCCDVRKVRPLNRALSRLDAWITGLRRDQASSRAVIQKVEIDHGHGNIIKVNPIAHWTWDMLWDYIKKNDVPYNKLHDNGYPSIGCEPCTRAIKPGEDMRAGRWWWEQHMDKECGMHSKPVKKKLFVLVESSEIPPPHGGLLVNRVLSGRALEKTHSDAKELMSITVNNDLANDIENIADGVFSPLEGFMLSNDFANVLNRGRLENGIAWTLPIVLDVEEQTARQMKDSCDVAIKDESQRILAIMHVEDVFKFNKLEMAQAIYQTKDVTHPGVAKTMLMHDMLIGGKIDLVDRPAGNDIRRHRLSPVRTRDEYRKSGWKTVVGFQTRNIPFLADEMLQKSALDLFDGLFVCPLVGTKKGGDFKDEVIIKAYETLIGNYYPKNSVMFATLHTAMRYAGPKEAILQAIVCKNFGCSHFILDGNHAGIGNYYDPSAAHEMFKDYPDLGIKPLLFPAFFYCKVCMNTVSENACPHDVQYRLELSEASLGQIVTRRERPPEPLMRPEVTDLILSLKDPFVS
jgi:sulfate adenylyltransferase